MRKIELVTKRAAGIGVARYSTYTSRGWLLRTTPTRQEDSSRLPAADRGDTRTAQHFADTGGPAG